MAAPLTSSASSEAPSSLEDSTYDLISNRDFSESDAASLTSFEDRQIPDDMSVVEHSDEYEEEEEEQEEDADALNTPLDSVMMRGIIGHANFGLRNPLTKVTAAHEGTASMSNTARTSQRSFECYDFDDATAASPSSRTTTHLSHEIHQATLSDSDPQLTSYGTFDVSVQLHFDIVIDKPRARQAYRLLLVGHDHTYDGIICEHVKSALKFNLSANNSLDDPSIVLDMMTDPPQYDVRGDEVALPIVGLTEPVMMKGPNKLLLQGRSYNKWDLVIFVHSSLADMTPGHHDRYERMMEIAQDAFRQHHYPAMHISAPLPLYGARPEYFSPGEGSLQLQVVTKPTADSDKKMRDVLPVDIDSFLAIDPEALGCHLDCLDRPVPEKLHKETASPLAARVAEITNAWRSFSRSILNFAALWTADIRARMDSADVDWINLFLGVVIALSAICIGMLFQQLSVSKPTSLSPVQTSATPSTLNATSSQPANWAEALSVKYAAWSEANAMRAAATSLGSRLSSSSVKYANSAESDLAHEKTVMPDVLMPWLATPRSVAPKPSSVKSAKPLKGMPFAQIDSFEEIKNDLLRYKLEPLSHGYVKITPPKHLPLHGRREVPRFTKIEVFKGTELKGDAKLDAKIIALEGGSVTISIPESQAQGKIVVAIWNIEHPLGRLDFAAPFPLDFTAPKTGMNNIKDFVMHETIVWQDAVAEVSNRMSTELQHYVSKLEQQGISLQNSAIKRVKETRNAIGNLSMESMALSPWFGGCNSSLQRLKHTEKLVKNSVPAMAGRIGVTAREVQHMALQHYQDLASVLDQVGKWQKSSEWPVRAQDWKPQVALGRGIGNAQGLVRKIHRRPSGVKIPKDPRRAEEDMHERHWPEISRAHQRKSKGLILARRGWHVR